MVAHLHASKVSAYVIMSVREELPFPVFHVKCEKSISAARTFPLTLGQPSRNIRGLHETSSQDRAKRTTGPLTIHIQLNRPRPYYFFYCSQSKDTHFSSEIKGESYCHSSQMSSPWERLYSRHVSIQVQSPSTETPFCAATHLKKYVSVCRALTEMLRPGCHSWGMRFTLIKPGHIEVISQMDSAACRASIPWYLFACESTMRFQHCSKASGWENHLVPYFERNGEKKPEPHEKKNPIWRFLPSPCYVWKYSWNSKF